MKTRNKMKKLEQEKFVIPKTVQNVIPIKAVYKDGIFLVGKNMYSKTFLFTDVNYYIACENEKNDLMRQYWAVINSFGNGVTVKLTINNHRFDKEEFEKSILMPYYYDNLDVYRKEYNEMLLNKAATSECIVQDKYFTVTVNKKCYEDARAFFTRIEKNLSTNLFALGSKCEPLNATDRLKIFHNFYRAGSEENFNLDFELLQNQGCDVRDYISPVSMDFNSDYMMHNGQYCRTVFLRNYGTFVDDNIITELTSINKNLMLSIDFIPIPVDEANKDVDNILLGVQSDKANFNRRQAQNRCPDCRACGNLPVHAPPQACARLFFPCRTAGKVCAPADAGSCSTAHRSDPFSGRMNASEAICPCYCHSTHRRNDLWRCSQSPAAQPCGALFRTSCTCCTQCRG